MLKAVAKEKIVKIDDYEMAAFLLKITSRFDAIQIAAKGNNSKQKYKEEVAN